MKQASPNYSTMMFQGHEAAVTQFRGAPIEPESWYVGTKNGKVEAGPFRDERSAVWNFGQMANTSGT